MNQVGLLGLFLGLLANACLGSQLDEFQSNRLALAGDAASIDQKIMDMDIKRSGMNEMNKFPSMGMMRTEMEVCEDQKSEKYCKKMKKKGKCNKVAKVCKKTCDLCDDQADDCNDTLDQLHCLSECPTPVIGSDPSKYHHILGRCYYFEAADLDFDEAMENCKTIFGSPGGRLFEPRNSVVNDAVANKAMVNSPTGAGSQWIGIRTDPNFPFTQRHFYHLSGGPYTSLSYGQWYPGEPNNSSSSEASENCVQIKVNEDGTWNDRNCENRYYPSICEIGHEVIW